MPHPPPRLRAASPTVVALGGCGVGAERPSRTLPRTPCRSAGRACGARSAPRTRGCAPGFSWITVAEDGVDPVEHGRHRAEVRDERHAGARVARPRRGRSRCSRGGSGRSTASGRRRRTATPAAPRRRASRRRRHPARRRCARRARSGSGRCPGTRRAAAAGRSPAAAARASAFVRSRSREATSRSWNSRRAGCHARTRVVEHRGGDPARERPQRGIAVAPSRPRTRRRASSLHSVFRPGRSGQFAGPAAATESSGRRASRTSANRSRSSPAPENRGHPGGDLAGDPEEEVGVVACTRSAASPTRIARRSERAGVGHRRIGRGSRRARALR